MEIVLPESPGWSVLPVSAPAWGRLGLVIKRSYAVAAGVAVPAAAEPVRTADTIKKVYDTSNSDNEDPPVIDTRLDVEAELALSKDRPDWHVLGFGTAGNPIRAGIYVNGALQLRYVYEPPSDPPPDDAAPGIRSVDPVNLFGYEPRQNRLTEEDFEEFKELAASALTVHCAALFESTRRSQGFERESPALGLPLPAALQIEVTAGATSVVTVALTLPALAAGAFVHEGGPDRPPFWCRHALAAPNADTVTLDLSGNVPRLSVLWRTELDLAGMPFDVLRRVVIEEDA